MRHHVRFQYMSALCNEQVRVIGTSLRKQGPILGVAQAGLQLTVLPPQPSECHTDVCVIHHALPGPSF